MCNGFRGVEANLDIFSALARLSRLSLTNPKREGWGLLAPERAPLKLPRNQQQQTIGGKGRQRRIFEG